MKRIWIATGDEQLGDIGVYWLQAWGLSRNERTGRWTLHDRRDDRPYGRDGTVGTLLRHYATTPEIAYVLLGGEGEPTFEAADLLRRIEPWHGEQAMRELATWIRAAAQP